MTFSSLACKMHFDETRGLTTFIFGNTAKVSVYHSSKVFVKTISVHKFFSPPVEALITLAVPNPIELIALTLMVKRVECIWLVMLYVLISAETLTLVSLPVKTWRKINW